MERYAKVKKILISRILKYLKIFENIFLSYFHLLSSLGS